MKNSKFGKNGWIVSFTNVLAIVAVIVVVIAILVVGGGKISKMAEESAARKAAQKASGDELSDGEETIENSGEIVGEDVPITIFLMDSAPDIAASEYQSIPVISADASSVIQQEGTSNVPILLFDGRDDTNWQEGVEGYGIGQCINFSYDHSREIKYMAFKLGNWKTDEYYYGNAMPRTMTFVIGDFQGQVTFKGTREVEWVEFSQPITAGSTMLIIDDVYPGSTWEDTCITEITVYGK